MKYKIIVDVETGDSSGGCESCDYGSSYEMILKVQGAPALAGLSEVSDAR